VKKIIPAVLIAFVAAVAIPATASAQAGAIPSSVKSCGLTYGGGLGVLVNSHTSCQFARAIGTQYLHRPSVKLRPGMYGPRPARIAAYSDASHRSLTMRCRLVMTRDSPYSLCTGGNNARVWIVS